MDGWMMTERPVGLTRFMAAAELSLQVTTGDGRIFATVGAGDVFALCGRDSLVPAGRRRRGGLDPQRACCVVAGRGPTAARATPERLAQRRRPHAWRPRPFRAFPRISGHAMGSGLSARDWRRYC